MLREDRVKDGEGKKGWVRKKQNEKVRSEGLLILNIFGFAAPHHQGSINRAVCDNTLQQSPCLPSIYHSQIQQKLHTYNKLT